MSKNRFAPWHTVTANKTSADSLPKAAEGSGGTNEHKLEVKSCSRGCFAFFCRPPTPSCLSEKDSLKEARIVRRIPATGRTQKEFPLTVKVQKNRKKEATFSIILEEMWPFCSRSKWKIVYANDYFYVWARQKVCDLKLAGYNTLHER